MADIGCHRSDTAFHRFSSVACPPCPSCNTSGHRTLCFSSIKTNCQCFGSVTAVTIGCHWLSSVAISLIPVAIGCHRLLAVSVGCHRWPSVDSLFLRLIPETFCSHLLMPADIGCHCPAPVSVRRQQSASVAISCF